MKRLLQWGFLLFLLAMIPQVNAQAFVPVYEVGECPLDVSDILLNPVECGYVTVPEDHTDSDGRMIKLAIAIVHTRSTNPAPDPVIFLQGGPGGAAVGPYLANPLELQAFSRVLENRDVILLDQRGIGYSQPHLDCPELTALYQDVVAFVFSPEQVERARQALWRCHDRHVEHGVNLAAYTTRQNAADVAMLPEALGYEAVNLYGLSYGTRLALTVMRDHPEGIRSVILNGPIPHNVDLAREEPANVMDTFQRLLDVCTDDLLCSLSFPDFEQVFYEVLKQLHAHPVEVAVESERTGRVFHVEVDDQQLMSVLFGMFYSREGIAQLPMMMYSLREGDPAFLADYLRPAVDNPLIGLNSEVMSLTVMCSDFAPFISANRADLDVPEPFREVGIFNDDRLELCPNWNTGDPDPMGAQAVHSDIPTLILAGAFDHVTPSKWGERTAETLPNSLVYTFAGQSHGIQGSCAVGMMAQFLDDPAAPIMADCVADDRPIQFRLSTVGTRPYAGVSLVFVGAAALGLSGYTGVMAWRRRGFAWRGSGRLIGWLPFVLTAVVVGLGLLLPDPSAHLAPLVRVRLVETIVPLAMAAQVAFLLAPDDEPGLEVLLACPRPLSWLLLERLALVFVGQGLIAVIGSSAVIALTGAGDLWHMTLRWLPPAMLLSGLALNATLRSRRGVSGLITAGVIWFALVFFGEHFVPGGRVFWPLNYVQPFLWPLHAFLQPGDVPMTDYLTNRFVVLAAGIDLIALGVRYARQSEQLLTGAKPVYDKPKG